MTGDLKKIIACDTYRYLGREKLSFLERILLPLREVTLYYLKIHRKAHFYSNQGNLFLEWYYRFRLNCLSRKYQFQIPYDVELGKGTCIVHFGRIIVAPKVRIGDNCNIFTGVTIGSEVRGSRTGVPSIGNNVWIGPNAVITGRVHIGDDVLIAGNSFVNFDVPSHSVVIGNPAKVVHKENATEGYICRRI